MEITHTVPQFFEGKGEVKGYTFTKMKETENFYIYEVKSESTLHYEIFRRKSTPICIDFDNRIYSETEAKEKYPTSKNFGDWAWTSATYERAVEKMMEEQEKLERLEKQRNGL